MPLSSVHKGQLKGSKKIVCCCQGLVIAKSPLVSLVCLSIPPVSNSRASFFYSYIFLLLNQSSKSFREIISTDIHSHDMLQGHGYPYLTMERRKKKKKRKKCYLPCTHDHCNGVQKNQKKFLLEPQSTSTPILNDYIFSI